MTSATVEAVGERHLAHIDRSVVEQIAALCQTPYAQAKPVIFAGAVKNPEGFFGESDIQQMMSHPWLVERVGLFRDQKQIPPPGMDHATVSKRLQSPYTADFVAQQRQNGDASLILRAVQRLPGPVRDLCVALAATGWPAVPANAFETPPCKQALATHWDLSPVIVVQTGGHKRWLIWEPVVGEEECHAEWDERKGGSVLSDEEQARMTPSHAALDITLSPGDLFYLPLGWLHAPVAVDDKSLHVSVSPLSKRVNDKYGDANHTLDLL